MCPGRKADVQEVQQLQKALTRANIPLANVISNVSRAMWAGDYRRHPPRRTEPWKLAHLAGCRIKSEPGRGDRSLEGAGELTCCQNPPNNE
ncbi:MAG: hypothetical protein ABJC09_01170 [Terriglobia bacterium]